jgi:ATP-dependent RNA helicase SUPV3L1/SUV3
VVADAVAVGIGEMPAEMSPDAAVSPASDVVEPIPADATHDVPAAVDAESAPEDETSAETAAAGASPTVEADAEPATVEVWRPGGRSADRRPRHDRNRHRKQQSERAGAQPAAEGGEPDKGVQARERHRRGRRRPSADAPAEAASVEGERSLGRESRDGKGRPPRERFHGKGRDRDQDNKARFQGSRKGGSREGRSDTGPSHRPYASSAPRERERALDPNSPFAKLAALKEQLAGRKE